MHLVLTRFISNNRGTLGYLEIPSECDPTIYFTLERGWNNNRPNVSCVPVGQYQLLRHNTRKYPNTWALVGDTIGHTPCPDKPRYACVFHAGNSSTDFSGCIGLGYRADILAGYGISQSTKAIIEFKRHLDGIYNKGYENTLEIWNASV